MCRLKLFSSFLTIVIFAMLLAYTSQETISQNLEVKA